MKITEIAVYRYVFLLFAQPSSTTSFAVQVQAVVNATTSRGKFNVSSFAAEVGLGSPLAGSFMLVAPDVTQSGGGGRGGTSPKAGAGN
jgi:phosphatidylethanolamine-binding protein